ncbi:SGNH/GDSL hydrolase family protein [Gordonia hydrophobica]|uniref:SGNH/GDSL hydrolase family protein n=1 Tax=Gordonia hydrophobica TaxID=40516 RepID=A0ABZ2TYL5_9ACTN|nr:SGNH/GDSL hydrolase family protein [Gordonia hydrophobica]MBM7367125.1 lysophospholipase L1-like esterase [Gordonia hydrophobica]
MTFTRYVALGDSFTEGVGDDAPDLPNGVRGWADRVAAALAHSRPDLEYANLAIRGRKMGPIIDEQVAPAIAMRPDLVTIYAGANDILRPKVDIDAILAAYDAAVERLAASGAHTVLFTAHDPGGWPLFSGLRGRFAIYTEGVREIADRHGATIVDFWRMPDYRDERLWSFDRLHMSPAGHQRMAIAVLDTLGLEHSLVPLTLAPAPDLTVAQQRAENRRWIKEFAAPWIGRRLRGTSSGDGMTARYPEIGRFPG